jgi:hypothetical protein
MILTPIPFTPIVNEVCPNQPVLQFSPLTCTFQALIIKNLQILELIYFQIDLSIQAEKFILVSFPFENTSRPVCVSPG